MQYLRAALEQLQIPYEEETLSRFSRYREMVLQWNEKINLTAVRDPEAFEIKHFVDSLACCGEEAFLKAERVIDVGTGAGFPGIPLALLYPEKQFLLMDSLNKRIRLVGEMARELGLMNVTVVHGRAEELGRQKAYREQFDLCLSRAVANLSVLCEYCLPFVAVGGYFGAYKGPDIEEESEQALGAIALLGGGPAGRTAFPFKFPSEAGAGDGGESPDHQILWFRKLRQTPAKYPRKAGTPGKEPLKR